ncbi:MAG: hypothetical protein NW226_00195 [Microscillaceae bacterium]|nr:hypothetical protein [Microscillaceae bacterium]
MKKMIDALIIFISLSAYFYLAYGLERQDFRALLITFALVFAGYTYLLFFSKDFNDSRLICWLGAGVLYRFIFLVALPTLSDDYFRFFWDGKLLSCGLNPYLYLPAEFIQTEQARQLGFTQELFRSLNSPNYYTVYPPLNQLCFALGVYFFPQNVFGAVVVMRLEIILAEIAILRILWKFLPMLKVPRSVILVYALNPLVIVELSGNLHFEAITLYFLLLALCYLPKIYTSYKYYLSESALYFACAVAIKLIPLILLPAFFRKLGWQNAFIFYFSIGIFLGLFFLPFYSFELVENMLSSVNLYFKTFEFNASVYYLVRWWGFGEYGYNIIASAGKNLSKIALLGILVVSFTVNWKTPWRDVYGRMLFVLSIYYFLSTTVHPWYLCNLVLLSVFSPYRYAIVWSGMAVLSYAAYQYEVYAENLYFVALEYGLVYGVLLWELLLVRGSNSEAA